MISIPPPVWLFCACAVFALVARTSVARLEGDTGALDRLPYISLVLVSCLASAAALHFAGPGPQQVRPQLIQAFLVGQLAMAGWIDRQTTWVPDSVLLMVLTASSAYVFTHSTDPNAVLLLLQGTAGQGLVDLLGQRPLALLVVLSLAFGTTIWFVAILLWGLQTMSGKGLLTPPDVVALGLPIYLLGISLETGLVYMVAVCLALIMQRNEFLRSVFSNQEAVKEGKAHLGLDDDGHAVAVLSLMFSILATVLVARIPVQVWLQHLFSCTSPSLGGIFICP
jgi:hypothetical protein